MLAIILQIVKLTRPVVEKMVSAVFCNADHNEPTTKSEEKLYQ
jgi:hypothetical protein